MREFYKAEKEAQIAQELFDKGLIWAVNHGALHQHGYALGVRTNDDAPDVVNALMLLKVDADDEDGEIIFGHELGQKGYKKFLDYMFNRFKEKRSRKKGFENG